MRLFNNPYLVALLLLSGLTTDVRNTALRADAPGGGPGDVPIVLNSTRMGLVPAGYVNPNDPPLIYAGVSFTAAANSVYYVTIYTMLNPDPTKTIYNVATVSVTTDGNGNGAADASTGLVGVVPPTTGFYSAWVTVAAAPPSTQKVNSDTWSL